MSSEAIGQYPVLMQCTCMILCFEASGNKQTSNLTMSDYNVTLRDI